MITWFNACNLDTWTFWGIPVILTAAGWLLRGRCCVSYYLSNMLGK